MRQSTVCCLVLGFYVMFVGGVIRARAGDLPDWFYKPLTPVGPLGKVGPLGNVGPLGKEGSEVTLPETLRNQADTGYLVCWSWNTTKDSAWRCTEKYEDNPRNASDFAAYQYWKYPDGQSFVMPVLKTDWDNSETRQKVMNRVKLDAIPAIMERLAGRVEATNPEQAQRIRSRIKGISIGWVNVKPAYSKESKEYKELRAGEVQASKKIGFDDDTKEPLQLEGTTWIGKQVQSSNGRIYVERDLKWMFKPDGKLEVFSTRYYTGKLSKDSASWGDPRVFDWEVKGTSFNARWKGGLFFSAPIGGTSIIGEFKNEPDGHSTSVQLNLSR